MTNDKSSHKHPRSSLPSEHPAAQSDEWAEIWQKSALASPKIETSESQTEQALESVHQRIDQPETSQLPSGEKSSQIWLWAAVFALFAAGLGYLLIPKQVMAPHGEIMTHTLPDGSGITLNSGSEISYNRLYGYFNRSIDLQGEAYFTVKSGNHAFRVHTMNAIVAVTGTAFNVRAWQNENLTEVAVAEGQVVGFPKEQDSDTIRISAGQKFSIDSTFRDSREPVMANIEYLTGWRNRLLYIKDRPLWVIFNELERRFDLRIEMDESVKQSDPMTVHYVKPDDPESIIADICRVKGLQFSRTANGFIIKN